MIENYSLIIINKSNVKKLFEKESGILFEASLNNYRIMKANIIFYNYSNNLSHETENNTNPPAYYYAVYISL